MTYVRTSQRSQEHIEEDLDAARKKQKRPKLIKCVKKRSLQMK